MKTCLFISSFHLLFTVKVLCKVLFYIISTVPLSPHRIAKCQEKNNVQALSKKDARAIRKISGMLKRMHMHTMP